MEALCVGLTKYLVWFWGAGRRFRAEGLACREGRCGGSEDPPSEGAVKHPLRGRGLRWAARQRRYTYQ